MIKENIQKLKNDLPENVLLEAAAKTRSAQEVNDCIDAGVDIIGQNYVQEGITALQTVNNRVPHHFIGHLQRNKVKQAIGIFDMIETLDSLRLAKEIDKHCKRCEKIMQVLIEVNSGREEQKFGVYPENVENFLTELAELENISVKGLMTMGPFTGDSEIIRPYFKATNTCFEACKSLKLPNMEMRYLSMGMTNSYKVAIEEGANIVRVGTKIFGPRR